MKTDGWQARLRAYLDAQAGEAFSLGGNDCGSFAGGAVEAMTGTNPHTAVAGRYRTMAGALRALRKLGHEDHVAYAASVLDEIEPAYAAYGDIAAVPGESGLALGVVTGTHIAVRAPEGLTIVPLTAAVRVFRA